MNDAARIFTIGHSTHSVEEFSARLAAHGIQVLVDVRRHPGSRRNPQFGQAAIAAQLAAKGIEYQHRPDLGGRRAPLASSTNTAWRNAAFRGYADHMQAPVFEAALSELMATAATRATVIMCAEQHPSQCHRRLIADAFVAHGWSVLHILGEERVEEHVLTPTARVLTDGRLSYPAIQHPSATQGTAGLFDEA